MSVCIGARECSRKGCALGISAHVEVKDPVLSEVYCMSQRLEVMSTQSVPLSVPAQEPEVQGAKWLWRGAGIAWKRVLEYVAVSVGLTEEDGWTGSEKPGTAIADSMSLVPVGIGAPTGPQEPM